MAATLPVPRISRVPIKELALLIACFLGLPLLTMMIAEQEIRDGFNLVFSVFLLVFVAAAVLASAARRTISLATVHLLGIWVMLVYPAFLAAYTGEVNNEFLGIRFESWHYLVSLAAIFVWSIVFMFAYSRTASRWRLVESLLEIRLGRPEWMVLVALSVLGLYYLASQIGIGVITRGEFDSAVGEVSVSNVEVHLALYPARYVPYVTLAFIVATVAARKPTLTAVEIVTVGLTLLVATLVINNLLSAPRNVIGLIGFAFVFILFFRRSATGYGALLVFFVFLFGVFPLDFGRWATTWDEAWTSMSYSIDEIVTHDIWHTFESLPAAIDYVWEWGNKGGSQLAGNLLFFVPREFWPDKAVGTGTFLAEFHGALFTNITCTLQCEAIVNFGFLGILPFAYVFGRLLRRVDDWYLRIAAMPSSQLRLIELIYPFLLGLTFFVTRGDLLSPLASTAALLLVFVPLVLMHAAVSIIKR